MADVLNRTTKEYLKSVNTPEYDPAEWIVNPDLSAVADTDKRYWMVDGDSVRLMTDTEKVSNYLPDAIRQKYEALKSQVNVYVNNHYDEGAKQSLLASWIEGIDKVYPNRNSMVESVWAWVQVVIEFYKVTAAAVFSATDFNKLDAITWDLSQFDAADPSVSVVTVKDTTN